MKSCCFKKKHAYRGADLSEVRRRDVWSILPGILREVIINALVHSDYSQRGAPIRVVFPDDRIEVESMGILLPGLTIEEMKQGASRIRNPVIARVFKEPGLIEQWGTGVRRIFAEARELNLPEPKIEEIALRLRFTVYLTAPHQIQTQETEQAEAQVEPKTRQVKRLLDACTGELSRADLIKSIGLKDRVSFARIYLEPALETGYIEMTQPDSPRSPTQKYRLTIRGKQMLENMK